MMVYSETLFSVKNGIPGIQPCRRTGRGGSMAHFFRPPSGERVSQKTVNLNLGGALSLGLWGPCESTGR